MFALASCNMRLLRNANFLALPELLLVSKKKINKIWENSNRNQISKRSDLLTKRPPTTTHPQIRASPSYDYLTLEVR